MRRLLPLLLLLVVVPTATAQQSGRVLVVRDFGDAPKSSDLRRDPGPKDSLRYLILREARPGDTIRFASPGTVLLNGPIRVQQPGLTIDGAVGEAKAAVRYNLGQPRKHETGEHAMGLAIEAGGVVVRNLTFNDASLGVGAVGGGIHLVGVRVIDNVFLGARSSLYLSETLRAVVRGNRFEGRQTQAIGLTDDARLTLADNTIALAGGFGVDGPADLVVVRDNKLSNASIRLHTDGAQVTGNTLANGGLEVEDVGEGRAIEVRKNEVGRILRVRAGRDAQVVGNQARRGIDLSCVKALEGSHRIVATGNESQGGLKVHCETQGAVVLRGNTLTGGAHGVLVTHGRDVRVGQNTITGNGRGVEAWNRTKVTLTGTTIRGNRSVGVLVQPGAELKAAQVRMGGNLGLGILRGVKEPAAPALTFEKKKGRIEGKACAHCRVELYEAEDGDEPGEGIRYLGAVRAGPGGRFVYPSRGKLECPDTGKVTATATHTVRGAPASTSEFAADVECACVVSSEFDVLGAPRTGFANYGLTIFFPTGARVGEATLTDPRTEKRPPAGALGPLLQWEETQNKVLPGRGEHDFFVTVTYRDRSSPAEPAPVRLTWRYAVEYEPPPGTKRCGARLAGIWRPAGR